MLPFVATDSESQDEFGVGQSLCLRPQMVGFPWSIVCCFKQDCERDLTAPRLFPERSEAMCRVLFVLFEKAHRELYRAGSFLAGSLGFQVQGHFVISGINQIINWKRFQVIQCCINTIILLNNLLMITGTMTCSTDNVTCHLKTQLRKDVRNGALTRDDRSTMVISLALNAANLQTLLSLQPFSHLELQPEDVLCSKLLSD